jgi:hypothetical protein
MSLAKRIGNPLLIYIFRWEVLCAFINVLFVAQGFISSYVLKTESIL